MNLIKNKAVMDEVKDFFFITLGLLLYTLGWAVFLLPYKIVTGGVTGVAAIVYYACHVPVSLTYFSINLVLLVAALKVLGVRFLIKTIYAIGVLSCLLWLAQEALTMPDGTLLRVLGPDNGFMSLVIGCCFTGMALATVFLHNGSTGGTDIVAAIVNKYHNLSLGTVLMLVDVLIIGSSFPVFSNGHFETGLRVVVTGLSAMMIENFILDYVMNRRRESVQFLIFSRKYDEIAFAIGTKLEHGVTILDGHGWYTGNEVKVLCILAKKNESSAIFRLIKIIDPNAFVSQSAVIGVFGEGFDSIKVKVTDRHADELHRHMMEQKMEAYRQEQENKKK